MSWFENHPFKMALICSVVIGSYCFLFHGIKVLPHDWGAVAMWIPVYISPLWAVAGASSLSERRKK